MSPTTNSAPNTPDPILAARAEVERIGVVRADATTSAAQPGDVIDRYKLLQLIGKALGMLVTREHLDQGLVGKLLSRLHLAIDHNVQAPLQKPKRLDDSPADHSIGP